MNLDILDVFYNNVIYEASTGRVNCLFMFNILFHTNIVEDNILVSQNNSINNLMIPTLIIKDKRKFNMVLTKYIECAKSFYDLSIFEEEFLSNKDIISKDISIEKVLMTLVWSNATVEDFENPISFLMRRIDYLNNKALDSYLEEKNIGCSEILKSKITAKLKKESVYNETPYSLQIKLIDINNEDNYYLLPNVRIGISNNKAYIYAIQNDKNNKITSSYQKSINRKLFKIGDNFRNEVIHEDDNLKDVTSSFVVALNIVMGILNKLNIEEILVPSILISRWNGAIISENLRGINNREIIQPNLTEKFLRTFRRLVYHFENIKISNYPFECDSYLHLSFAKCYNTLGNNDLLNETFLTQNDNKGKMR